MNIFMTIKNDSMNMKEATVYAASFICNDKYLYIEINCPSASPNIPVEVFKEMISTSYFMGINNQDIEVPIKVNEKENKINLYTSDISNCKEKFKNFLKDCLNTYSNDENERIRFICENPFDWTFFVNTFFDFTKEGSPIFFDKIYPEPIIIQSVNASVYRFEAALDYYEIKNNVLSRQIESINSLENSEEELMMFKKLKIFSENMFMKEYFENIFSNEE